MKKPKNFLLFLKKSNFSSKHLIPIFTIFIFSLVAGLGFNIWQMRRVAREPEMYLQQGTCFEQQCQVTLNCGTDRDQPTESYFCTDDRTSCVFIHSKIETEDCFGSEKCFCYEYWRCGDAAKPSGCNACCGGNGDASPSPSSSGGGPWGMYCKKADDCDYQFACGICIYRGGPEGEYDYFCEGLTCPPGGGGITCGGCDNGGTTLKCPALRETDFITASSARLDISNAMNACAYLVRYRKQGEQNWNGPYTMEDWGQGSFPHYSYTARGLESCTSYEWQAVVENDDCPVSPKYCPSQPMTFTTLGCVSCSKPPEPIVEVVERQGKIYEQRQVCNANGALCTNDTDPTWMAAVDNPASPCNIKATDIWENPPGVWSPAEGFQTQFAPASLSHDECKAVNFRYTNLAGTSSWPATPWVKIDTQPPPVPSNPRLTTVGDDLLKFEWDGVIDNGCAGMSLPEGVYYMQLAFNDPNFTGIDGAWISDTIAQGSCFCGDTLYARVKARDNLGNESDYTSPVSMECPCPSPSPSASPSPSPSASPVLASCDYDFSGNNMIDEADLTDLSGRWQNYTDSFAKLLYIISHWGMQCI